MSRLKSYDIFVKADPVLRRISLLRNGIWTFATIPPDRFVRETKTQRFYLINELFGLCVFNQNNPKKTKFRGKSGDYIAADINGNLTLVTAEDYRRKFPKEAPSNMVMPLTSDDFLRESSTNTSPLSSNSSRTNSSSTGATTNARPTNTASYY